MVLVYMMAILTFQCFTERADKLRPSQGHDSRAGQLFKWRVSSSEEHVFRFEMAMLMINSSRSLSTSDHAWTTATKLGDAKTTCIDSESSIDGSRPGTSSLADAVELSEKLDASLESMASSPTSSPFHQSSIEHYSPLTSSPPNHHQHLLQRHIFTVATPTPLPPRPATAAAVIGASVHRRRKSLGDMLSRRSKSVAEVVMPEALELAEARKEGGMLRRAKTTGVSKKE